MSVTPLLEINNLSVLLGRGPAARRLVHNVSFSVGREKVAIVGESGAGKSTVGRAIMKLLPPVMSVEAQSMQFGDVDILNASERAMMDLRGRRLSMIMQDPKYSLNPVISVGEQISETWLLHRARGTRRAEARDRALAMLEAVKIRDPARVYKLYPHEVSGGMGQRIMIAMMLIADPELLIADEPTSALDVTVKLEILALLDDLTERRGMGMVFVTHDLNLVKNFCDRVVVMYAGRVVEVIRASDLDAASHPYTQALLASLPSIRTPADRLPVMVRDPNWAKQEIAV